MAHADIGDDVFGEDPSVNELQRVGAQLFDKEAALFAPSGTMTNQIALSVHLVPGDEVVCHRDSHIQVYEGGGIARLAGASVHLVSGNRGRIKPEQVLSAINNRDDVHLPLTALVALEDTTNRGGGAIYDFADIEAISGICRANGLPLHLDGARVFNALAETGMAPQVYAQPFDSMSVCLSKGLGAPVGSLLLGSHDFIQRARRVRKVFGGGMRQAGVIASAGLYALKHNIARIREDHIRATSLADVLAHRAWVHEVLPVQTNIIICNLSEPDKQSEILQKLKSAGVLALAFGRSSIRFVTHLGIDDESLERSCEIINSI